MRYDSVLGLEAVEDLNDLKANIRAEVRDAIKQHLRRQLTKASKDRGLTAAPRLSPCCYLQRPQSPFSWPPDLLSVRKSDRELHCPGPPRRRDYHANRNNRRDGFPGTLHRRPAERSQPSPALLASSRQRPQRLRPGGRRP